MINDELIKYIDTQKSRGISREGIFKKLSDAGWSPVDINEGLDKIFSVIDSSPAPIQPRVQPTQTFSPTPITAPKEDLIPNLMPKVSGPAGAVPINQAPILSPMSNSFDSFRPMQKTEQMPSVNVMSPGPLPQSAVISSYRKDYQDTTTFKSAPTSSSHWGRFFLIFFLIIVLAGGGAIFASVKGYINLPFEIPFMKPTPEQALIKMANNLSKIETAHYDTSLDISVISETKYTNNNNLSQKDEFPGLNPVDSKDEFNISINAQTDIDKTSPQTPKYSTNLDLKFSPSIFGFSGLNSGFVFSNDTLYLKIPDIEFIKEYTGETKWVKLQKSDLEDPNIMNNASNLSPVPVKYDPEKQKQVTELFNDANFMGSVIEVGIEDVGSGPAYHYQTIIDKEKIKNFVSKSLDIIDNPDLVLRRQEIIDSISKVKEIKADLWVSKGSFMLNKIVVELPFEANDTFANMDSSTKANLKFTQTLSKINEPVTITIPTDSKSIKDLTAEYESKPSVKDSKIRANIYGFEPEAALFFDQHAKSYGKPNTVGNCTSPIAGSVFADSSTIKTITELTGGVGSCYSTAKSYAISFPLFSDSTTRFCMDSKGTKKETKTPLIGTVCK